MGYGNTEVFLTAQQREALITSLMGKTVDILIDRPIGHTHVTKGITLHYTINYGYLPGIDGGDGEEQDVYILGVDVPLKTFRGKIIAAIRRRDDNEDKLVAAPEGMTFSADEIRDATWFVEKYFDSSIQLIGEDA
jgi:inorganic pyrophosphatase